MNFIILFIFLGIFLFLTYIYRSFSKEGILFLSLFLVMLLIYSHQKEDYLHHSNIIIISIFIFVSFVDIKKMIIPDLSIIFIFIIQIIKSIICIQKYNNMFNFDGLIYVIIISVIILGLSFLYKKELFGIGDIKLYLVLSINESLLFINMVIVLSCFIGIFISLIKKKKQIAFGEAICLSYAIIILIIDLFFS